MSTFLSPLLLAQFAILGVQTPTIQCLEPAHICDDTVLKSSDLRVNEPLLSFTKQSTTNNLPQNLIQQGSLSDCSTVQTKLIPKSQRSVDALQQLDEPLSEAPQKTSKTQDALTETHSAITDREIIESTSQARILSKAESLRNESKTVHKLTTPKHLAQLPGDVLQVPESPLPESPVEEPKENPLSKETVDQRIFLEALTSTSSKYPWIVNPSDGLSFDVGTFRPNRLSTYTKSKFRFADNNPTVNQLGFGHFPKNQQFYWLLDGNRIVLETSGVQGGVVYQGQSTELHFNQIARYHATFLGNQFVVTLPPVFEDLVGEADIGEITSVQSSAVQVINPEGFPVGDIVIDQNVDINAPNVRVLNLSAGGSGVNGAGTFFTNLDAINTPQILQAFPTVNLQPLLTGSTAGLEVGSVVLPSALEASGIRFGDPVTGEGFEFNAATTSTPGIKLGQGVRDDQETSFERLHDDLLNLAINPSLTTEQRDFHYLNSLHWTPIFRPADLELTLEKTIQDDWYRAYLSKSHQRSLLHYDPEKIQATYSNVFSNPGVSITSNTKSDVDWNQSLNSTVGLLLGGVFELVNVGQLNSSLEEAHDKHDQKLGFTPLQTKATSAQRRQINLTLNAALSNADRASALEQLSGSLTFPSTVRPDRSNIFQLRTGNYKRRVEFAQIQTPTFDEGNTVFSRLRLSNENFGPLGFVGGIVPLNQTGITPVNEGFAVETVLTNSNGQQFVQQFSSSDNTVVPFSSGRAFGLALDKFDLIRNDERTITQNLFVGSLSLPSIEAVMAGTLGKLNYGISAGTWLNVAPSRAPGVRDNTDGLEEPKIGVYAHANFNWTDSDVIVNDEKQPIAVITHTPFLDLNWNSAANRLNSVYLTAGYSFRYTGKRIGFVLTPAFSYIPSGINNFFPGQSNGEVLGFLNGEVGIQNGITLKTNLEIGKDTFYDFELSKPITKHFALGAYVRNSTTINPGLESRVDDLNYGGIVRYKSGRFSLESRLGNGDEGFDSSVHLGMNF